MRFKYKLVKRKGRFGYQIYWSESRKPRFRPTGTDDLAEAQIVLASFILDQTAPVKRNPDEMLVADVLDDYAREHAGKLPSKNLVDIHLKHLKGYFGSSLVSLLSRQSIGEYIAYRGKSDGTLKRELSTLKASLNHAYKEGRLSSVPHIPLPSQPPPKERWLSRNEVALILEKCGKTKKSAHLRLFIQIALHTGQRKRAILELQWFQVDFENRVIHFNPPGRKQTAKKRVSVPINAELYKILQKARKDAKSEWVVGFLGKKTFDVRRAFTRLCDKCGLGKVTPHALRHTAGTWMAQAGVDMIIISGILGHSYSRTTELYIKHSPDHLRSGVDALSNGKQLANKDHKNGQKRSKQRNTKQV